MKKTTTTILIVTMVFIYMVGFSQELITLPEPNPDGTGIYMDAGGFVPFEPAPTLLMPAGLGFTIAGIVTLSQSGDDRDKKIVGIIEIVSGIVMIFAGGAMAIE